MACTISAGIAAVDCYDGIGGNKKVYITEKSNITSITKTGAQVTAVAMASGKQFFLFAIDQETSNVSSPGTKNLDNGTVSFVHTLTCTWRKLSITKTNLLKILMQNPSLVAIVEDNNGNFLMLGYNIGGHITANTPTTGTKIADKNGYDWTFTANDPEEPYFVDSSLIAALILPAS